jgi:hypothetical protein
MLPFKSVKTAILRKYILHKIYIVDIKMKHNKNIILYKEFAPS